MLDFRSGHGGGGHRAMCWIPAEYAIPGKALIAKMPGKAACPVRIKRVFAYGFQPSRAIEVAPNIETSNRKRAPRRRRKADLEMT
jgi:hypothetical protein